MDCFFWLFAFFYLFCTLKTVVTTLYFEIKQIIS